MLLRCLCGILRRVDPLHHVKKKCLDKPTSRAKVIDIAAGRRRFAALI